MKGEQPQSGKKAPSRWDELEKSMDETLKQMAVARDEVYALHSRLIDPVPKNGGPEKDTESTDCFTGRVEDFLRSVNRITDDIRQAAMSLSGS